MSIERENTGRQQNQSEAKGQASGQQTADFGNSYARRERPNWSTVGQAVAPRVPRGNAGAALAAFDEVIKKALAACNTGYTYKTVRMDVADFPQLKVSVLVVAGYVADQPDLGIGYHIYILEGSIDPIAPMARQEGGQTYQVHRVVGDAYNREMENTVRTHLGRLFSTTKLFSGQASVVPRDLKLEDTDRIARLSEVANAATAMAVETNIKGFQDLNITEIDSSSQQLISAVTMPDDHVEDAAGRPVRSDFIMNLVAQQRNQQQDDTFGFASEDVIASATGFVDLAWYPEAHQQVAYGQQQPAKYLYVPNLVITGLSSRKLLTPGMVLLALANTYILRNQNAWTMAFNPRTQSVGAGNLRDIGGIGVDANIENSPTRFGQPIPTNSDAFRPEDFVSLMQTYVRPYLTTSIDIPECDSSSWWMYLFGLAGAGDAEAKIKLLNAANQLTGGHFATRYKAMNGTGEVIRSMQNRIHLGYYIDDAGSRRDVRDYDQLAMLNIFGTTDPMVAREWSDSFLDVMNKSQDMRLSIRRRTLERIKKVEFTGYAVRNIFENTFIDALSLACQDAGLVPQARLPHQDMGVQSRAVGNMFDFGMVAPGQVRYGSNIGINPQGGFSNTTGFSRFVG